MSPDQNNQSEEDTPNVVEPLEKDIGLKSSPDTTINLNSGSPPDDTSSKDTIPNNTNLASDSETKIDFFKHSKFTRKSIILILIGLMLIVTLLVIGVTRLISDNSKSNQTNKSSVIISSAKVPQRIAYVVSDGSNTSIYTADMNGNNQKLIYSFSGPYNPYAPYNMAPIIGISPDGKYLAILSSNQNLYLVASDGSGKKLITNRSVNDFVWFPDSDTIAYDWTKYPTKSGNPPDSQTDEYPCGDPQDPNCPIEDSQYDVMTDKTSSFSLADGVSLDSNYTNKSISWFSPDSTQTITIYSFVTHKKTSLNFSKDNFNVSAIDISPNGTQTIAESGCSDNTLSVGPNSDTDYCDIYKLLPNSILGNHFLSTDQQTGPIVWGNDNTLYYAKDLSTTTTETDGNVPETIYNYNFSNNQANAILSSTPSVSYQLEGTITNKSMIDLATNNQSPHQYTLETRNLDGNNPTSLIKSNKVITYLGLTQ